MILLLLTLPLALLCLALAWLAWSKNRRTAIVLLLFAAGVLGGSLAVVVLIYAFACASTPL